MAVILDENNNVDVQYSGTHAQLINMLGGLSVAKDWCVGQLKVGSHVKSSEPSKKVGKRDAMDYYLNKRQEAEDALKAVSESDDRAQFEVS